MIKNIVFDIGGVLIEYEYSFYANKISMPQLKEIEKIIVKEPQWREYLNGKLKVGELVRYLENKYPTRKKEINIWLGKEYQKEFIFLIEENIKILQELKQMHYNIYLLSNLTKETFEILEEQYQITKRVTGAIYSYQENCSKPDKKIYQILLERYQLNPKETLFIDDAKKNVEVAQALGMIGIQYQDNLKKEIQKIV